MKIRIFALAKELGMDSKDLIEVCSQAGIQLKNSALASISPEERDLVVGFLNAGQGSSGSETEPEVMVPTRDVVPDVGGKIRTLPKPSARTQTVEEAQPAAAEPADLEPVVEPAAVEPESELEPPVVVAESEVAEPEATADVPEAVADSQPEPEVSAETQPGDESPAKEPAAEVAPDKPVGISRDEYVSATGSSRGLREMKPIGTSDARRKRSKPKKEARGAALPSVAAPPEMPAVRPKAPKPQETAQKPVIPLTAELYDKQGPLGDRLRTKDRDKVDAAGEAGEAPRRAGRRRTGSLLEQRKRERETAKDAPPERRPRRQMGGIRRKRRSGAVELKSEATIELPITVRSLSEAIGRPAKMLMSMLFKSGRMVTINEGLEEEEALALAMELGVDLEIKRGRDLENELAERLEFEGDDEELAIRPPIVTILGHVDHGKTSLLDKLRAADVAGGEAGGITQHIASYQVERDGKKITFVDTPGHAAFGEMRARGANVTDIIVLVVAADDGIMPQTIECISHAKAAGVPIIVAMNKIDLPDVDEQRVLQGLAGQDILPAEWGGEVEVVRTSAMTGKGLDDLLETILLTAELHEYQANPDRPAVGVCLESFRDEGRGALAWLIVQSGTLRVGDILLCGSAFGRVRAIYNDRDEEIEMAGPSTPVKVAGLDSIPGAGSHFFVMDDIEEARTVAEERQHKGRTEVLARRRKPRTLDDILGAARDGAVQDLPLILKADTPGSIEALRSELQKFEHPEVRTSIIHEGVGGVNESDVYLASAAGAIIVAFHVVAEDRAEILADQEGVDIRRYNIIYEVTDHIRNVLEGLLRPEIVQVPTGRALVLRTFHISRFGTIAGCRVLNGTIERSNRVHVIRDQKVIRDYSIASLKREKDDVKEVREGMECGIRLDGFNDVKEGDLLEAFRVEEIQRKLEN